jgi:hypothetical protein
MDIDGLKYKVSGSDLIAHFKEKEKNFESRVELFAEKPDDRIVGPYGKKAKHMAESLKRKAGKYKDRASRIEADADYYLTEEEMKEIGFRPGSSDW